MISICINTHIHMQRSTFVKEKAYSLVTMYYLLCYLSFCSLFFRFQNYAWRIWKNAV